MDVAEQHRLQRWAAPQASQQGAWILQGDGIQAGVTDGQRGVVKGHNHGLTGRPQLPFEPIQLPRIEETRNTTAAVTAEHEQGPPINVQGRRSNHRPPPQGRTQQGLVVMVAGGQGQGDLPKRLHLIQRVQQTPVATPALVLAEVSGDQEEIRSPIDLRQGLPEAMDEGGHGGAAPAEAIGIRQKVGITELKEARHTNRAVRSP